MPISESVSHPGARLKNEVIPPGMTVTKAAQLIGVGRPALSNLLNGNASLSPDMAARIEKAFSYPREDLMEMQALYDADQAKHIMTPARTKAYVPPFLTIKANDIELWASRNISARIRLSVFLRTLVNSTGSDLEKVDFPGNDDAERPGWDGLVEANTGTPWVPIGRSGWEFGVNADIKTKADNDFMKSVKAISNKKDRAKTTFVFVTPRRWAGKAAWIEARKSVGGWKEVRVYDASDLEQWLEQSLPAQAWFANETHIPAESVRSLDRCWADWAGVSDPPLTGALFSSAIEAAKRTIISRLSKPSDGPIVVAADSTQEALAFLAQLFSERGGEELTAYRDRVLIFDKPGVLPRLSEGVRTFIPVVFTREAERELAQFANAMHSIVVYPRNAANVEPQITLEPVSYETFSKALEEMGKDRDEISRLADESGRSLTVLRRRVSTVPAVKTPEWAIDEATAARLVPFLFVGSWSATNAADRLGLSLLANDRPFSELEKECQALSQLNDAPVWSIGTYRGVISKIDLLHAVAGTIIPDDLTRYFSMARMVLGEDDPALDLVEGQRWAAAIHGKTREFSGAFRRGISETLVLLATYGSHLFQRRFGIDTQAEASHVVRDLLPTPLTARILEANDSDLPTYAEAAPDEFLSIIERDLKTDTPATLSLLRPVDPHLFGVSPSRTGLLWALEGLSWNPETLPRAVFILARLAQIEITDNWVNKPAHSLESIFRAWMPQTAASCETRISLMRKLIEKFPDVAWKICVTQFGRYQDLGHYSHKPRWRADGYGFGEPYSTWEPIISFRREMVEMALNWKKHSLDTLCDLVERLQDLLDEHQARIWSLIEDWAKDKTSDADKAVLREKIRISILSRRAALVSDNTPQGAALTEAAKAAYEALEPNDLLDKHAWLFRDTWIEESADEIDDIKNIDFGEREERIKRLRIKAMHEILKVRGFEGLIKLAERGKASWQIGLIAAQEILSEVEIQKLLGLALRPILDDEPNTFKFKNLIAGALRAIVEDDKRERILHFVAAELTEEGVAQLLSLAPYNKRTWAIVDASGKTTQTKYWEHVVPDWVYQVDTENNEGVERLLKAERPRAAFACIRHQPNMLDPLVLFRLLSEMASGGRDQPGEFQLDHYHLDQAFKHVNTCSTLTLDQKAGLEFAYIEVLSRSWDSRGGCYGIPNLERYVETHPEIYVQAIAWTYKRKDDSSDPAELQVPADRVKNMAERGYKLLDALRRIPGHDNFGDLKTDRLAAWITTVRNSCADLGRSVVADQCIGKLLAHASIGVDSVWPCEQVRDVMEAIQSEDIMKGAQMGVYNSRGAHFRSEGGGQERELADRYRKWGHALQLSHPFVASKLLMELVRTYDNEASYHDTEAGIRRRLR